MRPDVPRPVRQESREIVELRTLGTAHPELADAVAMQIELVTYQRRLQARIPTPIAPLSRPAAADRLRLGERLVDFEAIPLDWSAARQAVRATADILRRHNNLDGDDHAVITALVRDAHSFERLLKEWYAETGVPTPRRPEWTRGPTNTRPVGSRRVRRTRSSSRCAPSRFGHSWRGPPKRCPRALT